jgi:hypothetical protein
MTNARDYIIASKLIDATSESGLVFRPCEQMAFKLLQVVNSTEDAVIFNKDSEEIFVETTPQSTIRFTELVNWVSRQLNEFGHYINEDGLELHSYKRIWKELVPARYDLQPCHVHEAQRMINTDEIEET